ncbi:hypothetical protein BDK51DRAFT_30271 [Blyttiomyces helicus]|uniref:Uncharacterized protein n=1 Tax=Blyttiomyces helicus TaxID=388810 RepID=A0A4P9WQB0_9FUNG|nr:hypothetical protein BDK51DRAFT_30271 [Blyttiomyces helicus]|eukprot:RKO94353.1 hypothetical protein BDK51DRAFT_30271 [Blyttiomyces helicus]
MLTWETAVATLDLSPWTIGVSSSILLLTVEFSIVTPPQPKHWSLLDDWSRLGITLSIAVTTRNPEMFDDVRFIISIGVCRIGLRTLERRARFGVSFHMDSVVYAGTDCHIGPKSNLTRKIPPQACLPLEVQQGVEQGPTSMVSMSLQVSAPSAHVCLGAEPDWEQGSTSTASFWLRLSATWACVNLEAERGSTWTRLLCTQVSAALASVHLEVKQVSDTPVWSGVPLRRDLICQEYLLHQPVCAWKRVKVWSEVPCWRGDRLLEFVSIGPCWVPFERRKDFSPRPVKHHGLGHLSCCLCESVFSVMGVSLADIAAVPAILVADSMERDGFSTIMTACLLVVGVSGIGWVGSLDVWGAALFVPLEAGRLQDGRIGVVCNGQMQCLCNIVLGSAVIMFPWLTDLRVDTNIWSTAGSLAQARSLLYQGAAWIGTFIIGIFEEINLLHRVINMPSGVKKGDHSDSKFIERDKLTGLYVFLPLRPHHCAKLFQIPSPDRDFVQPRRRRLRSFFPPNIGHAFESRAWVECQNHVVDLVQVFRQSDPADVALLNNLRKGVLPDNFDKFIKSAANPEGLTPDSTAPEMQIVVFDTQSLAKLQADGNARLNLGTEVRPTFMVNEIPAPPPTCRRKKHKFNTSLGPSHARPHSRSNSRISGKQRLRSSETNVAYAFYFSLTFGCYGGPCPSYSRTWPGWEPGASWHDQHCSESANEIRANCRIGRRTPLDHTSDRGQGAGFQSFRLHPTVVSIVESPSGADLSCRRSGGPV